MKKEIKTKKDQKKDKFSILLYWSTDDKINDLKYILDKIQKKEKNKKKDILILARYKFNFDELNKQKIQLDYSDFNFSFNTIHSSKGNEADYVILLNIENGRFGFPARIEDDPILNLVQATEDNFEDSEERRLFYVAMTRSRGAVFLVADKFNKSVFVNEIIDNYEKDIKQLNNKEVEVSNCPVCKSGLLKKRSRSKETDSSKKNTKNYFYGCSNYPRCNYTENLRYCPECNSELIKNKSGVVKCSNNNCQFEPLPCNKCNGFMVKINGKYGPFLGCSNYQHSSCDYKQKI